MLPKAILFDYGMTLCTEPDADYEKGAAVLLSHAAANPQHITPPALQKAIWDVLADFGFAGVELDRSADAIWAQKLEVHFLGVLRYVLERLGLVLDVDLWHAEMLYWDACSPGSPAPGAAEMLEYLDTLSIPYGVVSNMWFTGATLERRIVSCLPHANFRFILASHDYAYRKPDRHSLRSLCTNSAFRAGTCGFAATIRFVTSRVPQAWACGRSGCGFRTILTG